jgi:hypothetical protein
VIVDTKAVRSMMPDRTAASTANAFDGWEIEMNSRNGGVGVVGVIVIVVVILFLVGVIKL